MLRYFATLLLVLFGAAPSLAAQTARIPVSIVEGRLVVRCDISTRFRRIPVNLFVDYEEGCGLQLHNQAAAGLKSETADGRAFPITVHLPGLDLEVERREIGDDEYLDEYTKWNSIALGEVSVVGTIGAKLLKDYYAIFDLDAGFIELAPPRARETEPTDPADGVARISTSEINDIVWLPVTHSGGSSAAMVLGTGTYDTVVDAFLADDLGFPAGDIGEVILAERDVASFVVLRPDEVNYMHPDGALGVTGLNLLEHFRVEVDRVNHYVYLEQMRAADLPAGDQRFFAAMVDEDAGGIAAFLDEFSDHRLTLEAARLLVTLRLIEGANKAVMRSALDYVNAACPEDLRATSALALMKTCNAFGNPQHVIAAGELGLEGGRDDRYPDAVHKIHARLGEVHLAEGNEDGAWRHLLSAAFGMPEDGMVNLHLGSFYESQGRFKRAFSRYLQAAIKADSGPQAVEGMSRIASELKDGEGYTVDVVERMIAGKVRNFGPASEFKPNEENTSNRVALVEFFTNSFLGNGSRGAIGGALANEGLTSHFAPEQVAFLSYHLASENLDPLINELGEYTASLLGLPGPWVHVVDGRGQLKGAGKWSDAEGIYNEVRLAVLDRLPRGAKYEFELTGAVEEGVARGELTIRGEPRKNTRVQIVLAEKGVLFPGTTEVVVHRMLARAALTGSVGGLEWEPTDGVMTVPFELSLADIRAANDVFLDELCRETDGIVRKLSMSIDPAQVRFVAHLRDSRSGRVLQAAVSEPTNLSELESGSE